MYEGEPPRQTHQARLRAFRIGKFCRIVKVKPDAASQKLIDYITQRVANLRGSKPYLFAEPEPVECKVRWYFPFPAAVKAIDRKVKQPRTQRPDLDNMAKNILDALTDAGCWADDSQVVSLQLEKHNAPSPCIVITLSPYTLPTK